MRFLLNESGLSEKKEVPIQLKLIAAVCRKSFAFEMDSGQNLEDEGRGRSERLKGKNKKNETSRRRESRQSRQWGL